MLSLVRRAGGTSNPRLREIVADFERLPDVGSLSGGAVFCALGTTIRKAGSQEAFRKVDYDYPMKLAEATRRAGATSFALVSSIGADAKSSTFYLRVKGELEDALGRMGFRSLHLFEPSFLMGDRKESRPGERIGIAVARATQFLLVGGLQKYRPAEGRDVGKAMVAAVLREQPGTRVYRWTEIQELSHG